MTARRIARRGMTLIEILIAMSIMGIMMMIAWSTIKSASQARVSFEDMEERNHEIRTGLSRMVFDLEQAYLSKNEPANLDNKRAQFVGKSDEVRFSTFGHLSLWADANESDQTVVVYYLDDDREDGTKDSLYRKELRRQSHENTWEREPGDLDILIRDVEKLELEYWDWKEKDWQSDWDSTKGDAEKDKQPTRVRIKLTYKNSRGDELTVTTQARLLLEESFKY
jgi:general secretion pathway protein J